MDERVVTSELCWIGIEEKDAADLKRSELNELVENWTCLNALEGKCWKSDQKVVMNDKINPKIVMDEDLVQNDVMDENLFLNSVSDEDLVQNGVMDGKFVKNLVMNAKIDPKVVMDLYIFKIGGWNSLQPINQN